MATIILLYTPDPSGSSEPPVDQTSEGIVSFFARIGLRDQVLYLKYVIKLDFEYIVLIAWSPVYREV